MKKNFTRFATACAMALTSLSVAAQVAENFNARSGATTGTQVKDLLLGQGWNFHKVNINETAAIEGGLSVRSANTLGWSADIGFTTPLIEVTGNTLSVGFRYKFDGGSSGMRSFMINLMDCNGAFIKNMVFNTTNFTSTPSTYLQSFTVNPGTYRVQLYFQGANSNARVVIDEFGINDASLKYTNGLNNAPVAAPDFFNGLPNSTASGNVLTNDIEPDGEEMSVALFEAPPANQGYITLDSDGSFTFTPAPGFIGSGVAFKYMVCDNSCQQLCAGPVQVLINLPVGAPTPVMMLSFTGTLSAKTVTLNWSTATELNNAKFEILRSEDGTSFSKVGEVDGRGTVTSITNYTWKENVSAVSAQVLHYKLKQLDTDGKYEFSKTVVVRLNADAAVIASVAPNPVAGTANLTVNLQRNSSVQVRLLNNMGKELARKNFNGQTGTNAFPLSETNDLVRGIYLLEVVIDNKERTLLKIVK